MRDHRYPDFNRWRRDSLEVLETYYGDVPKRIDTVNQWYLPLPTRNLDVGEECVLFC